MSVSVKEEPKVQFHEMGLDDRILVAISNFKWSEPTLIQEKSIPHFLNGKDVLARARTGSGKTASFLLPIIQRILDDKQTASEQAVRALILEPTKELCKQTSEVLHKLTSSCRREIRSTDVSPLVDYDAQKPLLIDHPDIVLGTPSRIMGHLQRKNLCFKNLKYIVIDEADLMIAFDCKNELKQILKQLPTVYQSFITSATLGEDVMDLKELFLHRAVTLKLEEPPLPSSGQLSQFVIELEDLQKAVFLEALFQLNLMRGKTVIFTNNVLQVYRLKMFLGQFGIKSCVLSPEMPVMSRCNVIAEFNKGSHNILIACDDNNMYDNVKAEPDIKRKFEVDTESGVSRGIDFKFISNIINFDFPKTVNDYIHRVGRTARGTSEGTALSLVNRREKERLIEVQTRLKELMGVEDIFKDFKFDMKQIQGFQYRVKDAWKRCTKYNIKDLRQKEIRMEISKCDKLERYFQENPKELEAISRNIHKPFVRPQRHLRHVPIYNIPAKLRRIPLKKLGKTDPKKFKQKQENIERKRHNPDPLRSAKLLGLKRH